MCGSLFGGGSQAAAPQTLISAPAPTSVAKSTESESVQNARKQEEERRKKMAGSQSTNQTGASGLGQVSANQLGQNRLLGA